MMLYDTVAPKRLITLQKWFSEIISQKLQADNSISSFAPNGKKIELEAAQYLVATKTLSAKKRLELYAQSYWLRLLDVLHQDFPMLYRLFGEHDFDRLLAIPYLECYHPNHWSLTQLSNRFVKWVEEHYMEQDFVLVHSCARIDWACQEIFLAKPFTNILLTQNCERLATEKICLQPTVRLFALTAHFLYFRKALLEHPFEHWQNHDFPLLEKGKSFYFILYRNPSYVVDWQELSHEEYVMLEAIEQTMSIEDAYESVCKNNTPSFADIDNQIAYWVQKWLIHDWIASQTESAS